ncbi:MAG: ABC transporter ATP-binding protein/permease [Pelosinus sp.]|nr:ABC transporter ATP-binding protein/permease [Pelosinus sp.]
MLAFYWNKFIRHHWDMVLSAILCFILASAAGLGAPLVVKALIDDALNRNDLSYLHIILISIVALYLLRGIFSYIYNYQMSKVGNHMTFQMRQQMFEKLQRLDYAYFINTPPGETISLFINDLWLIEQAVALGFPDFLIESITLLSIIAIMLYFNAKLAVITFITLPFIIIAIGHFNKKIAKFGTLVENTMARLTASLHQSLLSIVMVQSYVREEYEYKKISEKIRKASADLLKVQRLNAILLALVEFLAAMGLTIIIWYGGREVINGGLTVGGMFAFLIYIINVPTPVRKISEAMTRMKLGMIAWQRIAKLENQVSAIADGASELPAIQESIEFKNVSFYYNTRKPILKNVNLAAKRGDVIAVTGQSGAGKSSFANLLLRFYDPNEGGIFMDGVNIKDVKVSSLRSQIGFIQQEPILFNTSILENIQYGNAEATRAQIIAAAKLANAHDFIMELDKNYDYIVGEMGTRLSGGQRQRIAIARAIVKNPAILVLDEPTAALDASAEKLVMQAIRKASEGRITFLITHSLSVLINSDKVLHLANGSLSDENENPQINSAAQTLSVQ